MSTRKKKKSEKYHVANYIYKDFKNCKVRNYLSERVSIAPFLCELFKREFTVLFRKIDFIQIFKYSCICSHRLLRVYWDNSEFIGIILGMLFIQSLKKQNLSGIFYTHKVLSHFDYNKSVVLAGIRNKQSGLLKIWSQISVFMIISTLLFPFQFMYTIFWIEESRMHSNKEYIRSFFKTILNRRGCHVRDSGSGGILPK